MQIRKSRTIRSGITALILRRVSDLAPKAVKCVHALRPDEATGLVAVVYRQLADEFLINSPVILHSPVPRLLAGVFCILRESLITGRVPRPYKEAIATGVSQANACPYCVWVHGAMLQGNGDDQLHRLASWANRSLTPDDTVVRTPPFTTDVAEILGTAVTFHYINRLVNVFLGDSPVPLPRALGWLRGTMQRIAGATLGRRVTGLWLAPGTSLRLLPEAALPADLSWAASNPAIAGAFARMAAAADEAGRGALPDAVRELVSRRLLSWRGEAPGLGRGWVVREIEPLSPADRPLAAFALLTALASYQVDDSIVKPFRRLRPKDDEMVSAAAWAAFAAARRVGFWLVPRVEGNVTPSLATRAQINI